MKSFIFSKNVKIIFKKYKNLPSRLIYNFFVLLRSEFVHGKTSFKNQLAISLVANRRKLPQKVDSGIESMTHIVPEFRFGRCEGPSGEMAAVQGHEPDAAFRSNSHV